MAYYYLISSLPMLKSQADMPLSYNEFLGMCRSTLGETKYKMLEDLTLDSAEGPLLSEWAKFHSILKQELAFQRNVILGRKAQPPEIKDESIAKTVAAAINHQNPLVAEEMLLALQFQKLDELIGTHYFDIQALVGYALKLKLLERKSSFNYEKGKAEFENIIENLEQEILTMN